MPALDNMYRIFSSKVLFIFSATLFCCDVFLTVKCLFMPSSQHNCRKRSLVNSPPLSEQSTLLRVSLLLHKQLQDFPFVFHGIYPTSLGVIIYKRHKVAVTSNRCLRRSPNVCVNIIQNPLGAMSYGAEFHLGLLFNATI